VRLAWSSLSGVSASGSRTNAKVATPRRRSVRRTTTRRQQAKPHARSHLRTESLRTVAEKVRNTRIYSRGSKKSTDRRPLICRHAYLEGAAGTGTVRRPPCPAARTSASTCSGCGGARAAFPGFSSLGGSYAEVAAAAPSSAAGGGASA
jgi:hypothetical protein